jgi:signal transduction histidine kinase
MSETQVKTRYMQEQYRSFNRMHASSSDELHAAIAKLQEENLLLLQQNRLLQKISAEQDEFILMVAHDLKNPLTTIMLGTSFLQQRWRDLSLQDVIAKLRKMQDSAVHMKEMINRLLTTSVVESGKFDIVLERTDIIAPVVSVVNEYRTRAAEKRIMIDFESTVPDIQTMSHQGILREIMENLLSNAVKYSPTDKQVWVRVIGTTYSTYSEHLFDNKQPDDDEFLSPEKPYNFIRVEVQDEGPGLTQYDQRELFKKFTRLSAKPTAGEDSTGLGLSIVKKLVETLNGHIWCKSESGKGATFIVEFPIIGSIVA